MSPSLSSKLGGWFPEEGGRGKGLVGGVSDGELGANAEVMSQSRTMACRTRAETGAGGAVAEIRFPPRG